MGLKHLEGSGIRLFQNTTRISFAGTKYLNYSSRCPDQDSNRAAPK